jgi:hypothetical protein
MIDYECGLAEFLPQANDTKLPKGMGAKLPQ